MEESKALRVANYLDASALAKLVLDCPDEEPGRQELLDYFNNQYGQFYTTPTCFAETIGILKRKHFYSKPGKIGRLSKIAFYLLRFVIKILMPARGHNKKGETPISEDEYIKAYEGLLVLVYGGKLAIDEVKPAQPDIFKKAKRLVKKYKIDFADVMQIVTIMHGRFSHFCAGSQSILITADGDLADAAREEIDEACKKPDAAHKKDIIVWNCRTEEPPD